MKSLLVAALLVILPPAVTDYVVYEMWIPANQRQFNGGEWVVVHFVNGECLLDGKRLHPNIVRTSKFRKVRQQK